MGVVVVVVGINGVGYLLRMCLGTWTEVKKEDEGGDEPVSKPARRAKAKVCIFPNHCRPTVTNYSTELKDRREAAR